MEEQAELQALQDCCQDLSARVEAAQIRESELATELSVTQDQASELVRRLEQSQQMYVQLSHTLEQSETRSMHERQEYEADKRQWLCKADALGRENAASLERIAGLQVGLQRGTTPYACLNLGSSGKPYIVMMCKNSLIYHWCSLSSVRRSLDPAHLSCRCAKGTYKNKDVADSSKP